MSTQAQQPNNYRSGWILVAIRILAAIAIALSLYLASVSFSITSLAGCGGADIVDCDDVLKSRWSSWAGIPVSVFGAVIYAGIFATTFLYSGAVGRESFRTFCFVALIAALWFFGIQILAIQKICLWCSAVHLCGLLIFGLMFVFTMLNRAESEDGWGWLAGPVSWGMASLLVLVLGQLMFSPAEFEILDPQDIPQSLIVESDADTEPESADADDTVDNADPTAPTSDNGDLTAIDRLAKAGKQQPEHKPVSPTGIENSAPAESDLTAEKNPPTEEDPTAKTDQTAEQDPPAAKSRTISIWRDAIKLQTSHYPMLGDPDAEEIVVKMFDYSCPQCRRLHRQVEAYRPTHHTSMAVLLAPVPMNKACNGYVRRDRPIHRDACDYSKLALAVWSTEPSKFPQLHNWLMTGEEPPPVTDVVNYIEQQLGISNPRELAEGRTVNRLMGRVVAFYAKCGGGIVPKLFVREKIIVGAPEVDSEMIAILQEQLKGPAGR